jgi:hypothetical protein
MCFILLAVYFVFVFSACSHCQELKKKNHLKKLPYIMKRTHWSDVMNRKKKVAVAKNVLFQNFKTKMSYTDNNNTNKELHLDTSLSLSLSIY